MSVDEIERRLMAKADEPTPEAWKAERPGQKLIGCVVRYEKGTTAWGDAPICVVESLRTPGRLASVWIFGTVLANQFKKQMPQRGEIILVEYLGEVRPDGGGSPYKNWRVIVDRPAGHDGLDFATAFGDTSAPVAQNGAHETYEPPADWQTTGNADDRAGLNDPATATVAEDDDIPF